ncbi:MAG: ABC transporter permease [Porticoccaceae bacterium]
MVTDTPPGMEIKTKQNGLPPFSVAAQWPRTAMNEQQWNIAGQRWAILRQVYPQEAQAWVEAAICHQKCGNHDTAESLLRTAMEQFPRHAGVAAAQIRHALICGKMEQADQLARAARDMFQRNLQVLHASAQAAQYCGKMEEALALNAQARTLFPEEPQAWEQYAELAMAAEDWPLALKRWAEVRVRFPKIATGYERAAVAANHLGDDRLARQLKAAREFGHQWLESLHQQNPLPAEEMKAPARSSFFSFVDLVLTKAKMNLKSEASQNYLRYLWWLIDPLLYMTVFYIFFGLILHRGGDNYLAYLLTGIVPFQWFAKTVQQSSNSIVAGKGIMHQVRVSPLFFPLVSVMQNLGKQTAVFAMLASFLTLGGLPPTLYWLGFIPVFVVQFVLIVAASCLVAMIVPFIRDVTYLVPTAIQFLLFCSGVFTTLESIPEAWRSVFLMNPMANILYQYRLIFVHQSWPDWVLLGWLALGCAMALGALILAYRHLASTFPRLVLE